MRNGIMDTFTASHVGHGAAFKGETSNLSFPENYKIEAIPLFLDPKPIFLRIESILIFAPKTK